MSSKYTIYDFMDKLDQFEPGLSQEYREEMESQGSWKRSSAAIYNCVAEFLMDLAWDKTDRTKRIANDSGEVKWASIHQVLEKET